MRIIQHLFFVVQEGIWTNGRNFIVYTIPKYYTNHKKIVLFYKMKQ